MVMNFERITRHDVELVGGKGANLGEMYRNDFPVPNGFCITADAYRKVIDFNQLQPKIREILTGLDVENSKKLNDAAKKVQNLVVRADIPKDLANEIIKSYLSLKPGLKHPLVAVRSSATAEDLPDASFAGQQATFLNIAGEVNLIQAVRQSWASLFEARAIYYRVTKGFDHFKVALATPVQLMVQSEVSGIMFTINPVTNDKRRVVIESVWGLGEMIVQGAYTPDHYEVDKETKAIYTKVINKQEKQLIKHGADNKEVAVPKEKQERIKLSDEQILIVAELGIKLQQHYMFPQDSEWALENGKIYLVQTRPITTIEKNEERSRNLPTTSGMKLILKGDSASPGVAWGTPKLIKSPKEIGLVKEGDILVTSMTTPDFVPAMKKAAAIVTDKGGQTSHAAIVSRELGLPAVVGTMNGTKLLPKFKEITVNGQSGEIFEGKPAKGVLGQKTYDIGVSKEILSGEVTTATKVYVNLGEPELAGQVASRNVDGVGLLRAEFMMAQIGVHPKKMIRDGKKKIFIDKLADGLEKFTSAFGYRPVIYRASDFKTNEYRNLIGGEAYEPVESNPMLGYRGASRYVSDESVFELELEAIKEVRNKRGAKNLWLMIPFVRTVAELIKVKRIVAANGLNRSSSFKLLMMVEIPSNVILLEEFAKVGIDGISIGSNDLTMLTMGLDRDNETVAHLFDERDPAVMWMLEMAVTKARKLGLMAGICGQAPSVYPEITRKLVEWGVTSISVSPDVIERTRQIVYEAEKEAVSKK